MEHCREIYSSLRLCVEQHCRSEGFGLQLIAVHHSASQFITVDHSSSQLITVHHSASQCITVHGVGGRVRFTNHCFAVLLVTHSATHSVGNRVACTVHQSAGVEGLDLHGKKAAK